MSNDPINQSAELLFKDKKIEVATKQNMEIEEVIDTIDNDLGFFANSILSITVGKAKLREILTKQEITSKDDFLDAAFNEDAKIFGSEKLGSAANWIGKKTLEFSNYFSDVFETLQEKNKEILVIIAKYKIELDNLKDEILAGDEESNEDENSNKNSEENNENNIKPSTFGVGTMAYGTVIGSAGIAGFGVNKINKLKINKQLDAMNMDVERQKKAISNIIEELKTRKKWKGFDTPEGTTAKRNIQKSIDHFEDMKKDLSVSRKALADRKKLEKSGLLDKKAFSHFVANPKLLENLQDITKNGKLDELKNLLKSDPKKAKQLLGIADDIKLPKGVIKSINKIETLKDIGKIGDVLNHAKKLSRAAKFAHSVPLLDLAFLGLDIWVWDGARSESDKVRQYNQMRAQVLDRQANAHLALGIASASAEVILTIAALSSAGPAGRVVMGIGATIGGTAAAVDHGLDAMYYDVLDFYNQNTEDYINQYRTENKQAIVSIMQSLNPDIENASNEEMFIDKEDVSNKQKIQSMLNAYQGLILNEETLSLDDKDKDVVKTRMNYIKANIYSKEMITACANGDVNAPSRLLSESKSYEQMMQDKAYLEKNPDQKATKQSIIAYKAWLNITLENDHKESYQTLTKMSDLEFYWIYYLIQTQNIYDTETDTYSESKINKNISIINKVYYLRSFGKTKEEISQFHDSATKSGLLSLDQFLSQEIIEDGLKPSFSYSKEELMQDFVEGNTDYYEKITLNDISDDPAQNILYRLAKEVHGYNGNNTTESVLSYFSGTDKEDALGIYYDGDWVVNNDRAIDKSFDPELLTDPTLSTENIIKKLVNPHWVNHVLNFVVPGGIVLGATGHGFADNSEAIDTITETADESLNLNFWAQFARILDEERAYLKPDNKLKIETDIKIYIEENASDGYISLPYHLQVQALKAGLGNCENSFFKYEAGKIIEMNSKARSSEKLSFVDKQEIFDRPYDKLDKSEQKLFDRETKKFTDHVDKPLARLEIILQDGELDIPEAYQKIINDKINERKTLKLSLKDYEASSAKSKLKDNYEGYYKWFDNLYLSLLSGVYSNLMVADQDSAAVMNQHLKLAGSKTISIDPENGDLALYFQGRNYANKEDKDNNIEKASSNELTKMFFLIYSKVKLPYKGEKMTCEDMAKNDEAEAAEHYATLIRRSLLELETVDFTLDKDGNLKFDSLNSNLESGIEKHWDKALIVSPFAFPATLFSRYKGNKQEAAKQELFTKILAYNFKNNPYSELAI